MESLPALQVSDCVLKVPAPAELAAAGDRSLRSDLLSRHAMVDPVSPGIPQSSGHAQLYMCVAM